jgi:hypothetical protein
MTDTPRGGRSRPVVALDVDGVLSPWLNPEYGEWLLALADRCELVWATSWEHNANWHIASRIGLPVLEVIEFPGLVKHPAVDAWCGSRPLAWLDDGFGQTAFAWAAERNLRAKTLLVPVDPREGLQREQCARVSIWLNALAASSR